MLCIFQVIFTFWQVKSIPLAWNRPPCIWKVPLMGQDGFDDFFVWMKGRHWAWMIIWSVRWWSSAVASLGRACRCRASGPALLASLLPWRWPRMRRHSLRSPCCRIGKIPWLVARAPCHFTSRTISGTWRFPSGRAIPTWMIDYLFFVVGLVDYLKDAGSDLRADVGELAIGFEGLND